MLYALYQTAADLMLPARAWATAAGQTSNTSKLPTVSLDASSVAGSHLDVFDEKNPHASIHGYVVSAFGRTL